jgi:effector-binding domain-containing protein
MNVEPKLEYRKEQSYVAVRAQVGIPFGELLGGFWGEANAFLVSKGLTPSGPRFIRYLTTDMDKKLDIEVGFPVESIVDGNDRITTGVFPEGEYAVFLYFGHYDNLVAVTGDFLVWAEKNKITWQTTIKDGVEWWAGRIEWYPTDPDTEPDPQKWQTELAFLVK